MTFDSLVNMKRLPCFYKFCIIGFALALATESKAQIELENYDVPCFEVIPVNMNVLYVGVNNPVLVRVPGYQSI